MNPNSIEKIGSLAPLAGRGRGRGAPCGKNASTPPGPVHERLRGYAAISLRLAQVSLRRRR